MSTNRPFFAARIEDALTRLVGRLVRNLGWRERVIGYISYGSPAFVRILCRVVLSPDPRKHGQLAEALLNRRGWRNFITAPAEFAPIEVRIGDTTWQGRSGRGGFVDVRLAHRGLTPGWHRAMIRPTGGDEVEVPLLIIDPTDDFGIVSDIDDTVISTSLPRPLLAAWNTFVLHETARQSVPGMAELYRRLLADHPGSPIFYLSTGAWNVAPTLVRFLKHHRFPLGPLLLTDWGPTNTGWFRSGREHKERMLARLAEEFPNVAWLLVGDDGQHDPSIYGGFAQANPDRVRAIAIRQLTPGEQVLAHGTPVGLEDPPVAGDTPEVRGPDGAALGRALGARVAEHA
ncbi:phosphatidate phosphatase APP1 [Naumannella cuiyingiana]|uniref:Phosphatidate phosphatase APP1 n=1 Tax=Naumannella cuiyingiana TaxID=1347891 RepID=A0A7Z0DBM2_9ACTN|nr:phosphatase domain-containing protein [Naumannella cuiyingiana]NYI72542.1 phosphatidate phosphatase APP1 [Naumannella cuiyingiana]